MAQSNGEESTERRQQELYFNVDGVLTTLMLRTKQENMSVLDVKRRDEATERILAVIEAYRKQHELDAQEKLLDMAYDTIISYGYMLDDGKYMTGGFSTQELAFRHMRSIGAVDKKGLFDPKVYMKWCAELKAEREAL